MGKTRFIDDFDEGNFGSLADHDWNDPEIIWPMRYFADGL